MSWLKASFEHLPRFEGFKTRSYEEIMSYQDPTVAYFQLLRIFDKYVDKYNSQDKFIPAGHNVIFDMNMLNHFFRKNGLPHPKYECTGDPFLFSYILGSSLDTRSLAVMLEIKNGRMFKNHKLETLCEHYGIELDAHDAMNDINATRTLLQHLWQELVG
jgi:DNA polymerase-3 subunit epsilon